MSVLFDTTARLLAYAIGRAIVTRPSATLAAEPYPTFAIAPIRMVAEQVIYAIAYGNPDTQPSVVLTWNPLNREAQFLEPFAQALNDYLADCVCNQIVPRIWLPHGAALEIIELLGHRYRTNRNTTPTLNRMGAQCRLLADEATFAGQQIVAVACDVLMTHVATGQSPSEDQHLGALLAWVTPPNEKTAAQAAEAIALEPAAAMLARVADDHVEAVRERVRQGKMSEAIARAQIERIIRDETLGEWGLLVRARRAFWGLGLTQGSELSHLMRESFARIAWQIDRSIGGPSRPVSLAQRLDAQTYAQDLADYAAVVDDPIIRAQKLRTGALIRAVAVRREQPRRGFRPCMLTVETTQDVLRVRRGTTLQLRGTRVLGRVVAVGDTASGQTTQITIDITQGVRSPQLPMAGHQMEWIKPEPRDFGWLKRDIYARMADAADPRVYSDTLPANAPLTMDDNLTEILRRLRR